MLQAAAQLTERLKHNKNGCYAFTPQPFARTKGIITRRYPLSIPYIKAFQYMHRQSNIIMILAKNTIMVK